MLWWVLLGLGQLLSLLGLAVPDDFPLISPKNCSLDCIIKGGNNCEYCRITREDISLKLGVAREEMFGDCVPWPCNFFLGMHTPAACQHYVHAPHDVTVEFITNDDPTFETAVISWRPSIYGIAFLRGFQVSLQALGGPQLYCQLFLFQSNLSLSAMEAQRVYRSDPFPHLALGMQFAVTVMALPVPEVWDNFYHSKYFFTRTCLEKNGLEKCQRDWYPTDIKVQQDGRDIIVTFNLAPPDLGISHYFSWCYGGGMRNYTSIEASPTVNKTHHSYHLFGLQSGTNYSCEIAADVVDAIRKTFSFQVMQMEDEPPTADSALLALLLPVVIVLAIIFLGLLTVISKKKLKKRMREMKENAEVIKPHDGKCMHEEHSPILMTRPHPPRLLICYSSIDGPSHARAVMLFAAFMQQHMATQVCLDMWEALSLIEEGTMSWYCRRIQESDFVLVVCSRGLKQQLGRKAQEPRECWEGDTSLVAVSLIGEELGRAKSKGHDLSKYMTVIFDYSKETDIPAVLGLASRYSLMRDLPLLFSHLHGVALQRPGQHLQVEHISEEGYCDLPAGAALKWAIYEAGQVYGCQEEEE
ncbi:interleukin-17 receptor D [Megalops cyprinoides]|uniref:interleukin-17 receptor D n=1 Tax=Megalops cyprinoides TaxID=118141 RepID=UPI0018642678|nr:interleukin-17 receptor D [Megalops cyprinoides]